MPIDTASPVRDRMRARTSAAAAAGSSANGPSSRSTNASSMLSCSTSGDSVPELGHDRARVRAVGLEPGEEHGRGRGQAAGAAHRHRRPRAGLPGLVRRRRDDAARTGAADEHGLAAQRRLVALLDRGEERVRVGVQHGRAGAQAVDHGPTLPAAAHSLGRLGPHELAHGVRREDADAHLGRFAELEPQRGSGRADLHHVHRAPLGTLTGVHAVQRDRAPSRAYGRSAHHRRSMAASPVRSTTAVASALVVGPPSGWPSRLVGTTRSSSAGTR